MICSACKLTEEDGWMSNQTLGRCFCSRVVLNSEWGVYESPFIFSDGSKIISNYDFTEEDEADRGDKKKVE
jgi:hypothetical protein